MALSAVLAFAISRQSGQSVRVTDSRYVARQSALWAALWGLFWGLGMLQTSSGWSGRAIWSAIGFAFGSSLSLVAHPRGMKERAARAAGKSAISSEPSQKQKKYLAAAAKSVVERKISPDASVAKAALAMSDVWRAQPLFDRAALYVPCFWIAVVFLRSAIRVLGADFSLAARGLVVLLIPVAALVGRAREQSMRADAKYMFDALSAA
jgi:hypothetical protein